jgi:hypothetical protein
MAYLQQQRRRLLYAVPSIHQHHLPIDSMYSTFTACTQHLHTCPGRDLCFSAFRFLYLFLLSTHTCQLINATQREVISTAWHCPRNQSQHQLPVSRCNSGLIGSIVVSSAQGTVLMWSGSRTGLTWAWTGRDVHCCSVNRRTCDALVQLMHAAIHMHVPCELMLTLR